MLSKEASSIIFWVFGMTRPGIEPRSPGLLVNTLWVVNQNTIESGEKGRVCGQEILLRLSTNWSFFWFETDSPLSTMDKHSLAIEYSQHEGQKVSDGYELSFHTMTRPVYIQPKKQLKSHYNRNSCSYIALLTTLFQIWHQLVYFFLHILNILLYLNLIRGTIPLFKKSFALI